MEPVITADDPDCVTLVTDDGTTVLILSPAEARTLGHSLLAAADEVDRVGLYA
jgi:hypothetical protein